MALPPETPIILTSPETTFRRYTMPIVVRSTVYDSLQQYRVRLRWGQEGGTGHFSEGWDRCDEVSWDEDYWYQDVHGQCRWWQSGYAATRRLCACSQPDPLTEPTTHWVQAQAEDRGGRQSDWSRRVYVTAYEDDEAPPAPAAPIGPITVYVGLPDLIYSTTVTDNAGLLGALWEAGPEGGPYETRMSHAAPEIGSLEARVDVLINNSGLGSQWNLFGYPGMWQIRVRAYDIIGNYGEWSDWTNVLVTEVDEPVTRTEFRYELHVQPHTATRARVVYRRRPRMVALDGSQDGLPVDLPDSAMDQLIGETLAELRVRERELVPEIAEKAARAEVTERGLRAAKREDVS